jgi:hypothetical protein
MVFLVAFYCYPELTKSRKKAADYYIAYWTGWGEGVGGRTLHHCCLFLRSENGLGARS